eukprot:1986127-Pleurochrysis_carterae.AAC.1
MGKKQPRVLSASTIMHAIESTTTSSESRSSVSKRLKRRFRWSHCHTICAHHAARRRTHSRVLFDAVEGSCPRPIS